MPTYSGPITNPLTAAIDAYEIAPEMMDVDFDVIPRALFVGTGGDLTIVTAKGTTVTFRNLASGSMAPGVRPLRIVSATTTAGDLVACL